MTEKIDLYEMHKDEYAARRTPAVVNIGKALYLSISGRGAPGGEAFQDAVATLYAMAFPVKMASKAAGRDYAVCKLEALWWGDGDDPDFSQDPPETWNWKLMIRTPDFVTKEQVRAATAQLIEKGKAAGAQRVQLESLSEGRCVQVLHVGPYSEEGRTMMDMADFVAGKGLCFSGRHHEIYLSDPRRVEPARLRTILRMPVKSK